MNYVLQNRMRPGVFLFLLVCLISGVTSAAPSTNDSHNNSQKRIRTSWSDKNTSVILYQNQSNTYYIDVEHRNEDGNLSQFTFQENTPASTGSIGRYLVSPQKFGLTGLFAIQYFYDHEAIPYSVVESFVAGKVADSHSEQNVRIQTGMHLIVTAGANRKALDVTINLDGRYLKFHSIEDGIENSASLDLANYPGQVIAYEMDAEARVLSIYSTYGDLQIYRETIPLHLPTTSLDHPFRITPRQDALETSRDPSDIARMGFKVKTDVVAGHGELMCPAVFAAP